MGELFVLPADLQLEDDDGNNWTVLDLDAFRPDLVFPSALVLAGGDNYMALSTVLRTELFETPSGRQAILGTFRPGLSNGDRERFRWWWEAHGAT